MDWEQSTGKRQLVHGLSTVSREKTVHGWGTVSREKTVRTWMGNSQQGKMYFDLIPKRLLMLYEQSRCTFHLLQRQSYYMDREQSTVRK